MHLDGLNLSRAWCLRGIARALPASDPRAPILREAARRHLDAGMRGLASGDYVGAHWLATFATLALTAVDCPAAMAETLADRRLLVACSSCSRAAGASSRSCASRRLRHAGRAHGIASPRRTSPIARAPNRPAARGIAHAKCGGAIGTFREATQKQLTDMADCSSGNCRASASSSASSRCRTSSGSTPCAQTVEQRLDVLRNDNAAKLEQMRATVDEKLQATLEQRLGESFKLVSDRLEQVHRGLGEMQTLAAGVGDLKRVLGNVKTRGMWGEVQLAALLAEVLTPQQYATNVETVPGSKQRVEFAIRLPGRGDDGQPCWLPIDAKFPLDEWQRLQEALERADAPAADRRARRSPSSCARRRRMIRENYVAPPFTTDFAILFVPTEGLYAEMMARAGFAETLQREYRVMLAGPDQPPGAAQQPAAGLSHARDRAAVERSVARAGRGEDGVRASSATSSPRPRTSSTRRAGRSTRPACAAARSRASCATSKRCPRTKPERLLRQRCCFDAGRRAARRRK